MACLDETAVLGYLDAGTESDAIEAHLAECAACRMLVRLAAPPATAGSEPSGGEMANAPTLPDDGILRGRTAPLREGTTLGRYRIVGALGAGGMSVVYAAHDPQLDRKLAIKLLHGPASARAGEQLVREGRAIARLAHPNVVTVHDIGEDRGQWFVAMELVESGTLADWLRVRPRTAREILTMFVAAGRGLVAAHDAGLVHRDFKPTNVLVGADGRPRVSDFGIALLARDDGEAESAGTPAYMAPEQMDGDTVDARADQFSFAVALFEALDGRRPFAGTTLAALRDSMRAGPPVLRALVPLRVQVALRRALSEEPDARFGTLAELLRRIAPSRVRAWHVAGLVAALGGSVAAATVVASRPEAAPCAGLDRNLAGVWDPVRAEQLSAAFAATAVPDAATAARALREGLDRYATSWTAAQVDACEAAQVRREQTPAQQELRMACLDERLAELRGVTDVLVTPDREVMTNAFGLLNSLTPPDACADLTTLTERLPVGTADQIAKVRALRVQLGAVGARIAAGQFALAETQLQPLRPLIGDVKYRPLEAEAALITGRLADRQGRLVDAERALESAVLAAEAGRANRTAAEAWLLLVHVRTRGLGDVVRGADALAHAAATVERLGADVDAEADLAYARGVLHRQAGAYPEARAAFEEASQLYRRSRLERGFTLARVQLDLAGILALSGDLVGAGAVADAAIADLRTRIGDQHPELGGALVVAAAADLRSLEVNRAKARLDEAERILRGSVGDKHVQFAQLLLYRGNLLVAEGKHEAGLALLQQSRALFEATYGTRHGQVAALHRMIAAVAVNAGHNELARAELARATELFEAVHGRSSVEALQTRGVGTWLFVGEDRLEDAERVARALLADAREQLGDRHHVTADAARTLGYVLDARFKHAEALPLYDEAIAIIERSGGSGLRTMARFKMERGEVLVNMRRYADAIESVTAALAIERANKSEHTADARKARLLLGEAQLGAGDRAAGLAVLEALRVELEADTGEDDALLGDVKEALKRAKRR